MVVPCFSTTNRINQVFNICAHCVSCKLLLPVIVLFFFSVGSIQYWAFNDGGYTKLCPVVYNKTLTIEWDNKGSGFSVAANRISLYVFFFYTVWCDMLLTLMKLNPSGPRPVLDFKHNHQYEKALRRRKTQDRPMTP